MDAKNQTAMMKLIDLLKLHKVVMKKCPEIIEIIEELYVEIEKQQIEQAFRDGWLDGNNPLIFKIENEQYYNEKYKDESKTNI
jgi:hypothetical protein